MTWSGYFPFLFINRLKITLDRPAYLRSNLYLQFVSFYKSNYVACKMLNDYKSTIQNRAAPKVAVMVISRLFNQLTFMYYIYTVYYLMKLS